MGRRALPKIDAALDYSAWLLTVDACAAAVAAGTLFPRAAPWEVELGSGKGLFLASAAQTRPEHNFLGIELARKYAHFAAARLARLGVDNARMVHGDGLRVFRELLPAASITAAHVYFPDPWWKARHKKRRVMNEQFLRDVERVLISDGALHFWTDVEEYFQAGVSTVKEVTGLSGPFDVVEVAPEHDLDYRTHFERRTRLAAQTVYRAEFRKSAP